MGIWSSLGKFAANGVTIGGYSATKAASKKSYQVATTHKCPNCGLRSSRNYPVCPNCGRDK